MPDFPLPLPLTAFEEYMLRDDRPNYPMSIVARLRFTGQLDRRATSEALEMALARHPLLRAKIRRTPEGRLAWIPVEDYRPPIEWIDGPEHDRFPSMRPIDLFSEPGLRVWGITDAQHSLLSLQVHHAACDGKGVLQVTDDFLRSYARISAGKQSPIELSPCNPQTLQGRGSFGLTVGKYLRMLPAQLSGLLGVQMFLMRRPVPLLEPITAISSELPAGFPDVKVGSLESDEVRKLSAITAALQVTVNDWLIRDFFVAVDDFRSRHQATAAHEWIRFSIPMNLRQGFDNHMPAANVVSMVFLDRTPKQIANSVGLLRSIHAQMDLIRRRQLGLIFVLSLSLLRFLPGGLAKRVNKGRCEATCVLSNWGRVMADSPLPRCNEKIVAGNVMLESMDVFAPIRDGTAVSVSMVFYAGKLQVCMQYDSRHITEAQADDLMATYLQTIRASLDMASRAVQGKAA
ncbi:MAG: WS/DGAT domain-containing protein [Planctomycetota bacterium]